MKSFVSKRIIKTERSSEVSNRKAQEKEIDRKKMRNEMINTIYFFFHPFYSYHYDNSKAVNKML